MIENLLAAMWPWRGSPASSSLPVQRAELRVWPGPQPPSLSSDEADISLPISDTFLNSSVAIIWPLSASNEVHAMFVSRVDLSGSQRSKVMCNIQQ